MARDEARHGRDAKGNEKLVEAYFSYVRDLRAGKAESVERLLELWDEDGVLEFSGAPPVTGTFRGRVAIHTLYKNRLQARRMPVTLEGGGKKGEADRAVALGVIDTEVQRSRVMNDKVVAGWSTVIGTEDGRGFKVAGSHAFTFRDGRISSLKIVISPKADTAANLSLDGLTVDDIGRLALAAWPVV